MRIRFYVTVIAAVIACLGFYFLGGVSTTKMVVSDAGDKIKVPKDIVPYMPAILSELKSESSGSLCMKSYATYDEREEERSSVSICHEDCKLFAKMGLITLKTSGYKKPKLQHDYAQSDLAMGYTLTDSGRLAYVPRDLKNNVLYKDAQFCLGDTRYKRLLNISPIEERSDGNYVYVKYTKEVINPNPALYSAYYDKNKIDFGNNRVPVFPQNTRESIPIVYVFQLAPGNQIAETGHKVYKGPWAIESMRQETLEKQELEKRK